MLYYVADKKKISIHMLYYGAGTNLYSYVILLSAGVNFYSYDVLLSAGTNIYSYAILQCWYQSLFIIMMYYSAGTNLCSYAVLQSDGNANLLPEMLK